MSERPRYLRAAFLVPANLFALVAAALGSAVSGDPTPALVALGVEGVYLGALAWIPPLRKTLGADADARARGTKAELDALMSELSGSQREHFLALQELNTRILANYRKLPGGRILAASSEPRLDALLLSFLRLLTTLNHYRTYLSAADQKQVAKDLEALRAEVAAETNPKVREVKQNRVDILEKRVSRFTQAQESRQLVSEQLAGIEDLMRLTHEQSIAIRDPDSVNRQLEALSIEVQATDETVRELERFLELTDEVGHRAPTPVRGT